MSYWTKIEAVIDKEPADWALFAEVFHEYGIKSTIQTDQPHTISGFLYQEVATEETLNAMQKDLIKIGAKEVNYEKLFEKNWIESWKEFFKPKRIGQHWLICPTWDNIDIQENDKLIMLDPGQAFGTGDHPTTCMCLELLEKIELKDKVIADIGSGSGILSIACCLKGAKQVRAVDNDHASFDAAKENAALNEVQYEAYLGEGFVPFPKDLKYDIVVSNIISNTIIELAPSVKEELSTGGKWLISGVIQDNWPEVLRSLNALGFQLLEKVDEGEWIAAIFCL